jgi:hypothetical protein
MKNLNVKKAKTKKTTKIEGKNLKNESKVIEFHPLTVDHYSVIYKGANGDKELIANNFFNIQKLANQIGYKQQDNSNQSVTFKSEYKTRLHFGKQGSSEIKLKHFFDGQYFIYKKSISGMRKQIKQIKSLFSETPIITSGRRLDIATIAYMNCPTDLISLDKNIINASSLETQVYRKDPDNPLRITGIKLYNSVFEFKIYDKPLQVRQQHRKLGMKSEYIEFHFAHEKQAKSKNLRSYRIELKIVGDDGYIKPFEIALAKHPEKIDSVLAELLNKWFRKHQRRLVPDHKRGEVTLDKTNMSHWESCDVWKNFLTFSNKKGVTLIKNDMKALSNVKFSDMPKKNKTISGTITSTSKTFAKINQKLTRDDFEGFTDQLYLQYLSEVKELKMTQKEALERQARYMEYVADSEDEIILIRKDLKEKVRELGLRHHIKIADKERPTDEEVQLRSLGFYETA